MRVSACAAIALAAALLAAARPAAAHSWIVCTDYREENGYLWNQTKCAAWPRDAANYVYNKPFGASLGYNQQSPVCRPRDGVTDWPKATYRPGQRVCLVWPSMNHVNCNITGCNQWLWDNGNHVEASPYELPDPQGVYGTWPIKVADMGISSRGYAFTPEFPRPGFQNCPNFDPSGVGRVFPVGDQSGTAFCSNCFEVPTNMSEGLYVFRWHWEFNPGEHYYSCWDAKIEAGTPPPAPTTYTLPSTAAPTTTVPPPAPPLATGATTTAAPAAPTSFPARFRWLQYGTSGSSVNGEVEVLPLTQSLNGFTVVFDVIPGFTIATSSIYNCGSVSASGSTISCVLNPGSWNGQIAVNAVGRAFGFWAQRSFTGSGSVTYLREAATNWRLVIGGVTYPVPMVDPNDPLVPTLMPSATAGTGGAAVPTTTAAAGGTAPTGTASVPPIRPGKFVGVRGTEFVIDGCPFSFAGAGAYYFNYQPPAVIDAALDLAVTSNLRVIRTWAFREEAWLSAAPGGGLRVDNSTTNGVGVLDYGIKAARDRNVRLVMVLTNNWKDFGGCDVWTAAYGGTTHADFYTRTQVKEAFKGYIDIVVNRVNSLTGVAYKDDPTIMAWELMNEPRCQNGGSLGFSATCNAATITAWVAEMSAYLKSRVPNQLVAVGDEGFYNGAGTLPYAYQNNDGVDTEAYLALSSIDFGTFHMYPAPWGSGANEGPWGVDWIRAHGATGLRFGKPMLFEEYGSKDRTQRAGWYASWMAEVEAQPAVAGDLFWMISGGNFPDYDGYTLMGAEVTTLFAAHGARMLARGACLNTTTTSTATPGPTATGPTTTWETSTSRSRTRTWTRTTTTSGPPARLSWLQYSAGTTNVNGEVRLENIGTTPIDGYTVTWTVDPGWEVRPEWVSNCGTFSPPAGTNRTAVCTVNAGAWNSGVPVGGINRPMNLFMQRIGSGNGATSFLRQAGYDWTVIVGGVSYPAQMVDPNDPGGPAGPATTAAPPAPPPPPPPTSTRVTTAVPTSTQAPTTTPAPTTRPPTTTVAPAPATTTVPAAVPTTEQASTTLPPPITLLRRSTTIRATTTVSATCPDLSPTRVPGPASVECDLFAADCTRFAAACSARATAGVPAVSAERCAWLADFCAGLAASCPIA